MTPFCAVLFARIDSIYKQLEGCDVYDINRNALTFPGGLPIIGHPPCRSWGMLAHLAKPLPGEKDLAPWCVERVREETGIVEHPVGSRLWKAMGLPPAPRPGERPIYDLHGGRTILIRQVEWGHKCQKATLLYGVGVDFDRLFPVFPGREPTHLISRSRTSPKKGEPGYKPGFGGRCRKHQEETPEPLARQFVSLLRPPFPGREATHQIGKCRGDSARDMPRLHPPGTEETPPMLAMALAASVRRAA